MFWFKKSNSANTTNKRSKVRLSFDRLELRDTPSINNVSFRVNSNTALDQFDTVNASSTNGNSVAVWTHQYSVGDYDIRAQRFNASGAKVGGEIKVASSSKPETNAAVCMDADGWFYIAYEYQYSASDYDIRVARFNSSGVKQGSTIDVANTSKKEYEPSIACDRSGNFVVTYTLDFLANDQDIKGAQYTFGGTFRGNVYVATGSAFDERKSFVVRSNAVSNGGFGVAYERNGDIYFNRFSSTGDSLGTTAMSTDFRKDDMPSASIDNNGNYIVVWQRLFGTADWDIKGRKISRTGVISWEIAIEGDSNASTNPTVAYERTGGDFVVAYKTRFVNSTSNAIVVKEVNSNGSIRSTTTLHTGIASNSANPSLSIDAGDEYLLTFTLFNATDDRNSRGVFGRYGHIV